MKVENIINEARKKELEQELDWFDSLRDSLEDGEIDNALELVKQAIKLRKQEIAKLYADSI